MIERRDMLKAAAVTIPMIAAFSHASIAGASPRATVPDLSGVRTAADFSTRVMEKATLSLAASRVAVPRLVRADAREFAGFELEEAIAVVSVLQDLGIPVPQQSSEALSALASIEAAADGPAFDRAYMVAEYQNHAFLARLASSYLAQSDAHTSDPGERHGRNLATIALFAFNEHTAITRRISQELGQV
jgi:hypothetical protein